jgi:hypothetical protein
VIGRDREALRRDFAKLGGVVNAIAVVDAALLRTELPDLVLRPGHSVVARVASRGEGPLGVLVLAGVPLRASLPDEVKAGETLRLTVTEVSPERVVLRMDAAALAMAAPPPQPAEAPPARVGVDEAPQRRRGGGGDEATVALRFETPALGRLDLRVELTSGTVRATVGATPGRSFDLADGRAGSLRDALADKTARQASVLVVPRREPVDIYV